MNTIVYYNIIILINYKIMYVNVWSSQINAAQSYKVYSYEIFWELCKNKVLHFKSTLK